MFTKKIKITLIALLAAFCVTPTFAQIDIWWPDNFLNGTTTGPGGLNVGDLWFHRQQGTPGSFTVDDQWVGIGNPLNPFTGLPLDVYGVRIQENEQSGIMSLNDNLGTGGANLDFELQWGPNPDTRFRINFFDNPLNPSSTTTVLTGLPNGNVGMGIDNPLARLQVEVPAAAGPSEGIRVLNGRPGSTGIRSFGDQIGVYGQVLQTGFGSKIGSTGSATSTSSTSNYGISGFATNGSSFCVGVYGAIGASAATTQFAAYFNGQAFSTGGGVLTSDRRLKDNIQTEGEVMDKIMAIRPTTYTFKQGGEFENVNFAEGNQHGFIAQELEEVFPEMVEEHGLLLEENLYKMGKDGNPVMIDDPKSMMIKTVNYNAMIPVLTKGIQEQQMEIDAKDAQIADLQAENSELNNRLSDLEIRLAALEGRTASKGDAATALDAANVLYQNTPNPFSSQTRIRYELTEGTQNAEILVFDMNGRQLRAFNNLKAGDNSLTIEGAELEAGMYFYSLIVNGEEVATKRMILTK